MKLFYEIKIFYSLFRRARISAWTFSICSSFAIIASREIWVLGTFCVATCVSPCVATCVSPCVRFFNNLFGWISSSTTSPSKSSQSAFVEEELSKLVWVRYSFTFASQFRGKIHPALPRRFELNFPPSSLSLSLWDWVSPKTAIDFSEYFSMKITLN